MFERSLCSLTLGKMEDLPHLKVLEGTEKKAKLLLFPAEWNAGILKSLHGSVTSNIEVHFAADHPDLLSHRKRRGSHAFNDLAEWKPKADKGNAVVSAFRNADALGQAAQGGASMANPEALNQKEAECAWLEDVAERKCKNFLEKALRIDSHDFRGAEGRAFSEVSPIGFLERPLVLGCRSNGEVVTREITQVTTPLHHKKLVKAYAGGA